MSEIAIRNGHHDSQGTIDIHPGQDRAVERLVEWAQAADAAYQMARKLVTTQFVPQQYRGKPEEATAAILAGAELGLGPMAALRAFDPIQGTPAPKAITLRAIVQSIGHEIRIDESSSTRAVVSGRRKGDSEWQTSVWTIERAEQAGYVAKNPNYKTKAAEMLVARATSEVARWIASDAIMGMPYSSEEIRDEGPSFDARQAPPRVTAAEIMGTRDEPAPSEPQVDEADEPARDDKTDAAPAPMTESQSRKMFATFREASTVEPALNTKEGQLAYIAEVIGRQISSRKELTSDDARQVTDSLERFIAENEPAQGELVDGGES